MLVDIGVLPVSTSTSIRNGNTCNAYDEVPYKSYPFSQSHPDRLATIATLFGMKPPPLDNCRVLELGCSSGGNLIPIAEQYPESTFVGVELSELQARQGREIIESLGLKNIELLQKDMREIDRAFGEFDYIIAHGVYSWVDDDVQARILDICGQNLSENGVAYISYNTYPGWHMRGMIRDVMTYRARKFPKPEDRVRHARGLLDFLAQSVPSDGNAYGMLLQDELKQISDKEDYYFIHEYLEDVNTPVYFHEFIEQAQAAGLQYLGEADFRVMSASNFSPQIQGMLQSVSSDAIEMEQYMDFVRNRMFRQTLLCRQSIDIDRNLDPERVLGLHISTSSRPETAQVSVNAREQINFRRQGSVMTTTEPLVKAAMLYLGEVWPMQVAFTDLIAIARSRLSSQPVIVDTARVTMDSQRLAEPLLRCYATSQVDLSNNAPRFQIRLTQYPVASAYARLQAESTNTVTNLKHETTHLNDLQRHVIRLLDGQHDRPALLESLVELVRRGVLSVHDNGQPISKLHRCLELLSSILDDTMHDLARRALIQADVSETEFGAHRATASDNAACKEPTVDSAANDEAGEVDWHALG